MKDYIIASEVMGILITIVIFVSSFFKSRQKIRKHIVFNLLLIANLAALFIDLISWLTEGYRELTELNSFLSLITMIMCLVIEAMFILYICEHISERTSMPKQVYTIVSAGCAASVLFTIVGTLTGAICTVTDGVYKEGPFYPAYLAVNLIPLVSLLVLVRTHAECFQKSERIAVGMNTLFPVLAMAVNVFIPGFSVIYPAIAVSTLIVYTMMQAENEENYLQMDMMKSHQVLHDDMTGLLNRRAFTQKLEQFAGSDEPLGVIFGDINGLKITNDTYGHEAGDKLICSFARYLFESFRKDEIYRISGDEFVVLLPNISEAFLDLRTASFRHKMDSFSVPIAAIGFAYGTKKDAQEVLKAAEANMYVMKQDFYKQFPKYKR